MSARESWSDKAASEKGYRDSVPCRSVRKTSFERTVPGIWDSEIEGALNRQFRRTCVPFQAKLYPFTSKQGPSVVCVSVLRLFVFSHNQRGRAEKARSERTNCILNLESVLLTTDLVSSYSKGVGREDRP